MGQFLFLLVCLGILVCFYLTGLIGLKTFKTLNLLLSPFWVGKAFELVYSRYQIIFDGATRTIYSKKIFFSERLLSFDQLPQVKIITSRVGSQYRVSHTSELGHIISPIFRWTRSGQLQKEDFEKNVLPAINVVLASQLSSSHSSQFHSKNFVFYQRDPIGYVLSSSRRTPNLAALIYCALAVVSVVISFLFVSNIYAMILFFGLFFVLMLYGGVMLVRPERALVFDVLNRTFYVMYFNLVLNKHRFEDVVQLKTARDYLYRFNHLVSVKIQFKDAEYTLKRLPDSQEAIHLVEETEFLLKCQTTDERS